MIETRNASVQKLLEAFIRFRRLHWRQDSVFGLTTSEIILLSYIDNKDEAGVKVSELSNLLNVASPTITQQINNLETRGFVERSIDKEDRRVVRIRLTDKGMQAQQKASEVFLATLSGLVEYLGEEDSNKLAELLVKVFTYNSEVRDANPYHRPTDN